ncbi:alpha/beta hydrolase [Halorientalis sp. IM1011]|uniref:alpha/beta hydrolase n=1 Tax=Halorientalis sp. IM1011 TaxID=1932360 RepID=UPI000981BEE2|nr:alpha/beta hydrolase [Halorientalis sp. IM1011]
MGRGDESTRVTRRTYLHTVGTGAAAAVGLGTAATGTAGAFEDSYAGRILTRNHFIAQLFLGVDLTKGNTRTNYGTSGTIPGLTDDASPSELVVFVHRYDKGLTGALESLRGFNDAVRSAGYDEALIGLDWDADEGRWNQTVEIADRNADKLGTFVRDYQDENPDTDVRLVAHGGGAKTVAECLEFFMDRGYDTSVTSVDFLGGAIDNDSVATDGQYGQAIAEHCDTCRNYYKTDDEFLGWTYTLKEWDRAVGDTGAEGETPDNYEEYDVTDDVSDHDSFPLPDDGCVSAVVDNWS